MILLDTHAFVWWSSDRSQLSDDALAAIHESTHRLSISVVSAWEIALLEKKKRLELPMPATQFVQRALSHHHIQELPLKRTIAMKAVSLPDIHNDPFDRVLIAESLSANFTLITKDETIPSYPKIKTIW